MLTERGSWARLVITHCEAWLREARCYRRCSRSFLPTTLQFVIGQNFDLDICRRLHRVRDHGFASAPAHSWDRGARFVVRRFVLGLDEATTFFGGSTTEASACRRNVRAKIFYAVRSGQFAGSPRLGRL